MVHVNQDVVRVEMDDLSDHIVIGIFVGVKLSSLAFKAWLANFNNFVGEGKMLFHDMLRRGYFMLKIDVVNIIKRIIMLTPFKSRWGMRTFQSWVANFKPQPKGYANSNLDYLKGTSIKVSKHRLGMLLGFNKKTTQATK
jgi:hypothetical protein